MPLHAPLPGPARSPRAGASAKPDGGRVRPAPCTPLCAGGLLNVRDAYSHPLFHPGVDAKTGFRTRNILACAVKHDDCDSEPIAVLQARRGVGAAGVCAAWRP
jgi:hypothetical protein